VSTINKKLKAMKANPKNDWKMDDLKSIAKRYSIICRQPGTSHVTFTCENELSVTVPNNKPIKPIYIKKFVNLIESLNEENIL
jgi:hypothetical protein